RAVIEATVNAIRDRPIVVERRVDLADRVEDLGLAANVEERLLLAGEGSIWQVFGGCRGADGERDFTRELLAKLLIVGSYLGFHIGRKRRRRDPLADLGAAVSERFDVLRA